MERREARQRKYFVLSAFLLVAVVTAAGMVACSSPPPAQPAQTAAPAAVTLADSAPPPATGPARPVSACTDLIKFKPQLKDAVISSAEIVPTNGGVPEYCDVIGGIEQVILFEVALPTTAWNGKFFYAGGGGYNGSIPELTTSLVRGYASAGTDTGHRGFHWDASALYKNEQIQINYAYRGAHLATVLGKEITKEYYGQPERHSYFMGCSNGGKMALMAAQRYPEDYDGIVGGGYVVDRSTEMAMFVWSQRALLGAEIPPYKIPAMDKATLAACDARDGLKDGLIDRPDLCKFDPKVVTCTGADSADCLTPKQVEAWQKILDGPKNSKGEQLYVGYSPGHEGDYESYITGFGNMHGYPSSNFMYSDNFMRWVAFGPQYDAVRQFNFDTDYAKIAPYAKIHDANDPSLTPFISHGGKLILYNGWADHSTPPLRAVQYYEDMRKATPKADESVRLFMPPGLWHCSNGPGPNIFGGRGQHWLKNDPENDIMAALDQWVDKGTAPDHLIVTKFKDDNPRLGIARQRPVCAYPQVAKYKGSGSVDDAANFVCGAAQ